MAIPELDHMSNSWIVTHKATGKAIWETCNREAVNAIPQDKYLIETAYQYLTRLNREIQESKDALTVQGV